MTYQIADGLVYVYPWAAIIAVRKSVIGYILAKFLFISFVFVILIYYSITILHHDFGVLPLLPPSNGFIEKLISHYSEHTHTVLFFTHHSFYLQSLKIHPVETNDSWEFSRDVSLWLSTWIITPEEQRLTHLAFGTFKNYIPGSMWCVSLLSKIGIWRIVK